MANMKSAAILDRAMVHRFRALRRNECQSQGFLSHEGVLIEGSPNGLRLGKGQEGHMMVNWSV